MVLLTKQTRQQNLDLPLRIDALGKHGAAWESFKGKFTTTVKKKTKKTSIFMWASTGADFVTSAAILFCLYDINLSFLQF